MAGAQHRSVTGMDERTLGRIDLILFDADYRDGKAAIEDSWRVAVLASDPRTRAAHERARAEAVEAANQRRDPSAPRVRPSTTLHRAALAMALVAGVVAVALLSTPRTSALALRDVMLPAGALALTSAALLSSPVTRDGSNPVTGPPARGSIAYLRLQATLDVAYTRFRRRRSRSAETSFESGRGIIPSTISTVVAPPESAAQIPNANVPVPQDSAAPAVFSAATSLMAFGVALVSGAFLLL